MRLGQRFWWLAIILMLLICALIFASYWFSWSITGFLNKSLWDWMQLLIIPVVLAIGAFIFNFAISRNEQKIALDNQRANLLQTYLDRMSELISEKNLRSSQDNDEVRILARARTLTVLTQLDGKRKGNLIQFLSESQLINIIDLSGADLSGANLQTAHLTNAKLIHANLSNTYLRYATLDFANLSVADLRKADLRDTTLYKTDMAYANLSDVDLRNADLQNVQLTQAKLTNVNLLGTTIDEGTLYMAKTYAILNGTNLEDAVLKKEVVVEEMKPSKNI